MSDTKELVGAICDFCGKEIGMLDASYYARGPEEDIGRTLHAVCAIGSKDHEIKRLSDSLSLLRRRVEELETALKRARGRLSSTLDAGVIADLDAALSRASSPSLQDERERAARPTRSYPSVIDEIVAERSRQISKGYDARHDDAHNDRSIAMAAAAYAAAGAGKSPTGAALWPWNIDQFKPENARRNLIVAATLCVAEVERIERSSEQPCPKCNGSGFNGRGTGYDDVCDHCGGARYMPQRDAPPSPREEERAAREEGAKK